MSDWLLYGYSLLTVALFIAGLWFAPKLNIAILNPFILALCLLIGVLLLADIPFKPFYQGNQPLNSLLGVSVVALAVPFYERLPQIRQQWKAIALIAVLATVFAMLSGLLLGWLFGANPHILASILPKSVTTAIAVVISDEIGGSPALSSIGVIIAGLTGSAFGYSLLRLTNINQASAIGLSIGTASHALGTARLMALDRKAASYSSIALVLSGILSSLIAPWVFKLVVWV